MPYAARLRGFIEECVAKEDRSSLGMSSWYGELPIRLTFNVLTLERWFRGTEDVPCLMPGSLYALRSKGGVDGRRQSHWAECVFERQVNHWIRKAKITCLSRKEWAGMVYATFWEGKLRRLSDRYGSGRWDGMSWLLSRVDEDWNRNGLGQSDGGMVLVNGVRVFADAEKIEALREMHHLERKLRIAA
jgi:hypothetical protein